MQQDGMWTLLTPVYVCSSLSMITLVLGRHLSIHPAASPSAPSSGHDGTIRLRGEPVADRRESRRIVAFLCRSGER